MNKASNPVYGLIGHPVKHSFSKDYFDRKFRKLSLEADFIVWDGTDLKAMIQNIRQLPNIKGFSVTKPFKEQVIDHLDLLDEEASRIGAVNSIKLIRQEDEAILKGYNTDYYGFLHSLSKYLKPQHQKALILGTGGASKAVAYALDLLNISYLFVSRSPRGCKHIRYSILHRQIMEEHLLIINTTPLGLFPKTETFPPIPYEYVSYQHLFFDLIYNPAKTLFLRKAEEKGATIVNGLEMLYLQAEESWKIWNTP